MCPGVYSLAKSRGRTKDQTKLLTSDECNEAVVINAGAIATKYKVKTENYNDEVVELRQRIHRFKVTNPLTAEEIEDIQEGLDEDDDSDLEFEAIIPAPIHFNVKQENGGEVNNDDVSVNEDADNFVHALEGTNDIITNDCLKNNQSKICR